MSSLAMLSACLVYLDLIYFYLDVPNPAWDAKLVTKATAVGLVPGKIVEITHSKPNEQST